MYIKWNKYIFRQCLAGFVLILDSMLSGAVENFSGTLLAQLYEEDSHMQITEHEATWIASLSSIGTIIAIFVNVGFLQIFGRKWTYLLVSLSNMITWSLLGLSVEVVHLYIGRAFLGFLNGLSYAVCIIYIVEAVEIKYQNIALNVVNVAKSFSILFVDIMGSYVDWELTALVFSGFSGVCVVLLLYLQNTHVPYLQEGEIDKAAEHFFWYRKKTPENWEQFNSDKNIASVKVSYVELIDELKRREFLIPLGILLWFMTTMQFTGVGGIMLYSVSIMREVVAIDEYLTVIITDVLGFIASVGTLIILEMTGVRLLINFSSIMCSSSLLIISISLYLRDSWIGWSTIAVAGIWIFNFCNSLGYHNVFYILFGTLFTGVEKSSGMAIIGLYVNGIIFGMGHLVPAMFHGLGYNGMFLFFGVCTFFGGLGLYFIVPEIKGKNSEDIRLTFTNYCIRKNFNKL